MIRYREVPRAFVQSVYDQGIFGARSELADAHIAQSDLFIGAFAPRLLGVFGAKGLGAQTYVWFTETRALAQHKIGFLRSVHCVVAMLHAHYPNLVGLCFDPRSGAWLRWIGAEFTDDNSFSFRRA